MATIHDLPDEIILYICSFIPSKVVIATLSSVSRRFLELLSQGWYWRSRYVNSLSSQNTIGLLDELRMWQLGCIQGEFAIAAATGMAQNKQFKGASASLDCVRVMSSGDGAGGGVVVAGGCRDTFVYIWRQRHVDTAGEDAGGGRSMRDTIKATLKGHRGWVWSLATDRKHRPNLLCSGSWDHDVKIWDISTGDVACTISSQHRAAVLGLHISAPDMLVSACQDKHVRIMDLRLPVSITAAHKCHRRSVLCVAASQNYVYSGGEDKLLCVWDVRKKELLQQVSLPGIVPSLHLNYDKLSLATSRQVDHSKVHEVYLYDSSKGSLDELWHFDTGHDRDLTRVLHSLAMIATASKDGTVRLHSTDRVEPRLLACLEGGGEVSDLDYFKSTLAVPRQRLVEVWSEH